MDTAKKPEIKLSKSGRIRFEVQYKSWTKLDN